MTNPNLVKLPEDTQVLKKIPLAIWKKGDLSLQFFGALREIMEQNPEIESVRIQNNFGIQYVQYGFKEGTSDNTAETIRGDTTFKIVKAMTQDTGYQETDHIQHIASLTTEIANEGIDGDDVAILMALDDAIRGSVEGDVISEVKDLTKHDAQVSVHHLSMGENREINLHVTLHKSCATCTSSVLTTLNFIGQMVEQKILLPNAEGTGNMTLGKIIVEPTKEGSPSFSHNIPKAILSGEQSPQYEAL